MLNRISITLIVVLGLLATAFANTRLPQSQPNDAAAQKVQRKFKQYKRVHQEILKMIVDGKQKQAIMALREIVSVVPRDGESRYMLAVAYAAEGQLEAAVTSVAKALDLGIPRSRFFGGTKTGLEPLQKMEEFHALFSDATPLVHGPMLGQNTGTGISIWIRTASACVVKVTIREPGSSDSVGTGTGQSLAATDYTAVVRVDGLLTNHNYEYTLTLGGDRLAEVYKFHTLAAKHQQTKFRVAFGGGAGFVPANEYAWNTIGQQRPDVLMLLGDNVYSDAPEMPEMQHYCYYRRQSRPEFRSLVSQVPVYTIWDDHDFGTNDCQGGPLVEEPYWKVPVWNVFKNNWVNPKYGNGGIQPGCWYDYYVGNVHFIMLDGRTYRDLRPSDESRPTMLGPAQIKWLQRTIKESSGVFTVLVSPVPWVFSAKGDSKDTWNGFKKERNDIFDVVKQSGRSGVLLMSADRHRSDLWKIQREGMYPLYEFNSSRLTNQHVHPEMAGAEFSYNKKQSFGIVEFDTTISDPTVEYLIINIDGKKIHSREITRSEITNDQ
ncbi:MAG: alkaline phosphatase [Planctomycetaceae bacterium]|nr:alkaline phosphatase [Planctomycetaceae bacterium]